MTTCPDATAQARHLAERLQARLDAWDRDCDGGNKGYQCFCGEWDRQHKPDCDVLFYRELLALTAATAAQEAELQQDDEKALVKAVWRLKNYPGCAEGCTYHHHGFHAGDCTSPREAANVLAERLMAAWLAERRKRQAAEARLTAQEAEIARLRTRIEFWRREYGAFSHLSGETLAEMDRAASGASHDESR